MDGKTELTIAALIFLAGTAGLVSGEDIGGVETTTDLDDGSGDCTPMDFDSFNVYYRTTSTQSKCGSGEDGKTLIDNHNLFVRDTLPPVISLSIDEDWSFDNIPTGGYIPGNDYGDDVGIDEI
jgi:hypothetical protein